MSRKRSRDDSTRMSLTDPEVDACLAEALAKIKKTDDDDDDDFFNNLFSQAPKTASQESSADTINDTTIRRADAAFRDTWTSEEQEPCQASDPGDQRVDTSLSSQVDELLELEIHTDTSADQGSLPVPAETDTLDVNEEKIHAAAGFSHQSTSRST